MGRRLNYSYGLWAEQVAKIILFFKGYSIVASRKKGLRGTQYGEIDLVAKRGKTLCFVEVKKRASFNEAAEAVHILQQKRIFSAAEVFLKYHPKYKGYTVRFDAILFNRFFAFRHIKDAWRDF